MSSSARDFVSKWWSSANSDGLWSGSWTRSLEGLTPAQASWFPANAPGVFGERHSIWQIVLHMCLWREHWIQKVRTGKGFDKAVLDAQNFPPIADRSDAAWAAARDRLAASHRAIESILNDPSVSNDQAEAVAHFLPHDQYHFGQISLIRAMLGLKHIE